MEYRLTLDYALSAGRLAPWIAALRRGEASGLSCDHCGKVRFPPTRCCECGSRHARWVTLPGTATIVERSDGGDLSLALARFDGAESLATVRLQDIKSATDRGYLAAVADGPPALVLVPKPKDETP